MAGLNAFEIACGFVRLRLRFWQLSSASYCYLVLQSPRHLRIRSGLLFCIGTLMFGLPRMLLEEAVSPSLSNTAVTIGRDDAKAAV